MFYITLGVMDHFVFIRLFSLSFRFFTILRFAHLFNVLRKKEFDQTEAR